MRVTPATEGFFSTPFLGRVARQKTSHLVYKGPCKKGSLSNPVSRLSYGASSSSDLVCAVKVSNRIGQTESDCRRKEYQFR